LLSITGCGGKPSAANIQLRKELQKLRDENQDMKLKRDADLATIQSLKGRDTLVQTLPEQRLEKLFTTHGIALSKLTTFDSTKLRVFLTPADNQGQKLKAAGAIVIEAFDLSRTEQPRIGEWKFDVDQARSAWNGEMLLYAYVLECPWSQPPAASQLTVKASFTDELTSRTFTAQKQVSLNR